MEDIELYRATSSESMARMTKAVAAADHLLIAYEDGSTVFEAFSTPEGNLDFRLYPNDEPFVTRTPAQDIPLPKTVEEIAEALRFWVLAEYSPLTSKAEVQDLVRLEHDALVLTGPAGEDSIPLLWEGRTLRVLWCDDALAGFRHGGQGVQVDEEAVRHIQERVLIMASRVRGDWHVVANECIRLGSVPPTNLKPRGVVKIGLQLDHPSPYDPFRAEWVWLRITKVDANGTKISGVLLNQSLLSGASVGELITFSNRDVYAVTTTE